MTIEECLARSPITGLRVSHRGRPYDSSFFEMAQTRLLKTRHSCQRRVLEAFVRRFRETLKSHHLTGAFEIHVLFGAEEHVIPC